MLMVVESWPKTAEILLTTTQINSIPELLLHNIGNGADIAILVLMYVIEFVHANSDIIILSATVAGYG